jgi:hypothetical protein
MRRTGPRRSSAGLNRSPREFCRVAPVADARVPVELSSSAMIFRERKPCMEPFHSEAAMRNGKARRSTALKCSIPSDRRLKRQRIGSSLAREAVLMASAKAKITHSVPLPPSDSTSGCIRTGRYVGISLAISAPRLTASRGNTAGFRRSSSQQVPASVV